MNRLNTATDPDISRTLSRGLSSSRGKRLWLNIFWLTAALAGAWGLWWGLSQSEDTTQYTTQPAIFGGLSVTVSATGNLAPTNEVEVGSELSGIVKEVEVDYNDHVIKGQALARLDTTKLQAQVLQSKASLEAAKAKVVLARATAKQSLSDLDRLRHLQKLSGGKAVSGQDIDAAAAALERAVAEEASAKAEVARSKAVLEAMQTDLSKMVIRSPVNGIVLDRSIEPGQTVAASLQAPVLFTLAEDLQKMELQVDVDEADVGMVHEGQNATFTVDAYPDRKFPARIQQVRFGSTSAQSGGSASSSSSASTGSGVVTYKTVLNVENTDLSLRPGMTATAEITVDTVEKAILVPNAALRYSPDSDDTKNSARSAIMNRLMPRPPRPDTKKNLGQNGSRTFARVWTLENGEPLAIPVKTGPTDGKFTVIKEGDVKPDTLLIVGKVVVKK